MKIHIPLLSRLIGKINPWNAFVALIAIVGNLPKATSQTNDDFPKSDSFASQKDWVTKLDNDCSNDLALPLQEALDKSNPFDAKLNLPDGVIIDMWKHTFFKSDAIATVRKKSIQRSKGDISEYSRDDTEILIGADKSSEPTLHRFKLNQKGDWVPNGKEKRSIEDFSRELEGKEEGLVMRTRYNCNAGLLFSHPVCYVVPTAADYGCYAHTKKM